MIDRTGCERLMILLLAVAVACVPAEQKTKLPVESPPIARGVDSSVTLMRSSALSAVATPTDTTVHPATIGPVVSAACDSAAAIVRGVLSLETDRKEGDYHDSFRGASRTGCRLRAEGSFKALPNHDGPVDLLYPGFIRHGWRPDIHISSDGPDGSAVGMRRRDILCIVNGSWEGGDDSDTVARAPTPADGKVERMVSG